MWSLLFSQTFSFFASTFANSSCLYTRQPGTVFKKLDTRHTEILTSFLEIAHLIPLRTQDICLEISSDCKYCLWLKVATVENIEISLYAQARQSLLLLIQGNIYNRLRFLNKYLMFSKELNEVFRGNWSKFLTSGYVVFWEQFLGAKYLDTSFQIMYVLFLCKLISLNIWVAKFKRRLFYIFVLTLTRTLWRQLKFHLLKQLCKW